MARKLVRQTGQIELDPAKNYPPAVKKRIQDFQNFIVATIFLVVTAAVVCFPSICIWAAFGASIKTIIKNTKIKRIVEYLLALLLLFTAIIIIID